MRPQKSINKNRSALDFYPVVIIPRLIDENLPRRRKVRISSDRSKFSVGKPDKPTSIYPILASFFDTLFFTGLMAVILRLCGVYHHDGLAVAFGIFGSISFVFGAICIDRATRLESSFVRIDRHSTRKDDTFSEIVPLPDWSMTLANRVKMPSKLVGDDVPRGISEANFATYLRRYFGDLLAPSYAFEIPGTELFYSCDFNLILPSGMSFCIEIDEPYVEKTKEPHHCIDEHKDKQRDRFFVDGNWIVVRLSERQVVTEPISCCFSIARTIAAITQDFSYLNQFPADTQKPTADLRWTTAMARDMAAFDYRHTYLQRLDYQVPMLKC
jgi:hypothetical protein